MRPKVGFSIRVKRGVKNEIGWGQCHLESASMNTIEGTMAMTESYQNEVERNFAAFQEKLPELLVTHQGKYALLHRGEVIEFFDSVGDAARYGMAKYQKPSEFSVQLVTGQNMNLGHYSYAVHHLSN